jgi:hypothetical protein
MGQQAGTPMAGTLEGDGYFFSIHEGRGKSEREFYYFYRIYCGMLVELF